MRGVRIGLIVVAVVGLMLPMPAQAVGPAGAVQSGWRSYLCDTRLSALPTLRPSATRTDLAAARAVQSALIELDFPPPVPIKVDGWYGRATASAVSAYQRSQNLIVDGVVGPQTWQQLRQDVCRSGSTTTAAADMTTVDLRVSGCDGCTLTPHTVRQAKLGAAPYVDWSGRAVTVRGGQARFSVPTKYTRGMSLTIDAPWQKGDFGAVPLVALSQGRPGEDDPSTPEGLHCWKGTTAEKATLAIIVRRATVDGLGGKAVVPMAFLDSVGPPAYIPGHQDLPYCTVPR